MGRGIAHVAALAGLRDLPLRRLGRGADRGRATIHKNLDKGVALGKVEAETAAAAKRRLELRTSLAEAVADADLVIEAVPESMELKIETFQEVARHCSAETIFASNTSTLSITEMAAGSGAAGFRRHALLQPGAHHAPGGDDQRSRDLRTRPWPGSRRWPPAWARRRCGSRGSPAS